MPGEGVGQGCPLDRERVGDPGLDERVDQAGGETERGEAVGPGVGGARGGALDRR
jgi:hypothetical protein